MDVGWQRAKRFVRVLWPYCLAWHRTWKEQNGLFLPLVCFVLVAEPAESGRGCPAALERMQGNKARKGVLTAVAVFGENSA